MSESVFCPSIPFICYQFVDATSFVKYVAVDFFPVMCGQLTSCIWLKDCAQVKEELRNRFSAYYLISFLITNPPHYVCGLGLSSTVNYMGPSKMNWHFFDSLTVTSCKQNWNLLLATMLVRCIARTQVSLAKVWFCYCLTQSWFCPCVRWLTLDQIPCNCNSFHELSFTQLNCIYFGL